ncbi:bifunctional protein GlmU [Ruminiclostridium hungatei]|uniref:Bifunctional protein GlmU n=1 Tax=Ruminiclostridium hungatei TaxID=48256 RepID=A0A1V4SIV2_RUMHU|nr:UDP-N-acetylglucosamine pyrophosphorylase [Ruminiclostridium hungatei]OPX43808.1 bifunctional protein GlmU [Ruminiclostridium hungatei]
MIKILGLVISDNNNSAFKSKSMKESHNVLGQSIQQWSASSMTGITTDIQAITFEELEKFRQLVGKADMVVINWADQPLIASETIQGLLDRHKTEGNSASAIFGSCRREAISEAAIYIFNSSELTAKLDALDVLNLSREVLKQIFLSLKDTNKILSEDYREFLAVTDRIALAEAVSVLRDRILGEIMLSGVTIMDPASTYIDANVYIGEDTIILPNTILEGNTAIGEDCTIGPNSRLSNCKIGNNAEVVNSVAIDSSVGDQTHVGPFAYLRPGSMIGSNVKIGDFVEIKKAVIGDRTKISHLTYVGDAEVGSNVNIGCGVVFVNYDGKHKNRTVVGDNSFIGCNTNLVSPVVVHKDAYIAAGSTITDEVPENSLAIARERQVIKEGWVIKKNMKR